MLSCEMGQLRRPPAKSLSRLVHNLSAICLNASLFGDGANHFFHVVSCIVAFSHQWQKQCWYIDMYLYFGLCSENEGFTTCFPKG